MRSRRPLITALRLLLILGALSLAVVSVASSVGGPAATSVKLETPTAAVPIPASQGGGFYVADMRANLVLRVDAGGFVTTVAGTGTAGDGGDGGPATQAQLASPTDAVPMADGGILITDFQLFASSGTSRVRRVSPSGVITTVAGGASKAEAESCPGSTDKFGDGCQATQATLSNPAAAVPVAGGGYLIAEWGANDVRKVAADGVITRVAGSDVTNPTVCSKPPATDELGDGCPAVGAPGHGALVAGPTAAIPFNIEGAAVATTGTGFLITEEQGCRVRYVNGSGVISTVAGSVAVSGGCRESGPAPPETGTATALKLAVPTDARPTGEAGVFLVADGQSCTVYKVNMTTNEYSTFAKDATCVANKETGYFGTTAAIPDPSGGALVADSSSSLIDQASVTGALSVIAGGGTGTRPPDGLPGGSPTPAPIPVTPLPKVLPTPPPTCRITSHPGTVPLTTHKKKKGSKVTPQPKNTLAVSLTCSQTARVSLRGVITELLKKGNKTKKKTVALGSRTLNVRANVSLSTTLVVPAAAVAALKHRTPESAVLSLSAVNANGKGSATAKISRLSTKR